MYAVLLAGSFDWGECPLTLASPRVLSPIANRPLIAYVLTALKEAGVTKVSVCANGHTPLLRQTLGNQAMGLRIEYFADPMPRGPAGCARDAAALMGANEFIVIEGAVLPHIDIRQMVNSHRESNAALTIGVESDVPQSQWTEGHSPRILGVYVFSASVLPFIPMKGYHDIKEQLVPKLYQAGRLVQACRMEGAAPRVSGPESYLTVNSWALDRIAAGEIAAQGYDRRGDVFIHPKASVSATARLAGPVMIGPGTVIHDEAVIIGPTSIGAGCEIGSRAAVCFSAVWDEVVIGSGCHVDESIIATGARLGSNTQAIRTMHLPGHAGEEDRGVRRMLSELIPAGLWGRRRPAVGASVAMPLNHTWHRERACTEACRTAGDREC